MVKELTEAQERRYRKLQEEVSTTYLRFHNNADRTQTYKLGDEWINANERLDTFIARYL